MTRTLTPIGCLLAAAAMALAQPPAPAPPAPAAPPAAQAAPAPQPAPAPRALPPDLPDVLRLQEFSQEDQERVERAQQRAQEAQERALERAQEAQERVQERAQEAQERAMEALDSLAPSAPLFNLTRPGPMPAPAPLFQLAHPMDGMLGDQIRDSLRDAFRDAPLLAQSRIMAGRSGQNDDRLYNEGHRALDNHRYDEALEYFNQVAAHAGARSDAALYWKAYTLNKLGRRDEALAAIAELRKSYASSRWLDDAKALELEVKQASGRPVSPEAESDEELKLMAINSIMQSDPERAIPLLESILKSSQPPKVKDRALFVLAQSNAPRAQQVIEQIARGGGNPDLQLKAITYLSQRRRQGTSNPNLLPEIFGSTTDVNVKRAIISSWSESRDKEHLAQAAKNEKSPELRMAAISALAENNPGQPELWPIFQAETSPDVRQEILKHMYRDGNADKLAEVVRTEKDPKTRRVAIDVLASQQGANTGDLLVSVYNSEQDQQNKQAIIDRLSNARNARYLVELARNEKDSQMKIRIVDRLSNMHSKEASDYLMELLSK